jgi:aryl-alcohol dehydrogenase-like predicted oxidoreductase
MLPFEAEQFEAAVAHTRERLAPDVWQHAWADGRSLPLDDIVRRMEQLARRDHARSV